MGGKDPALPWGFAKFQVVKSFKAIFLIRVGQFWVIKGGHFSVVNSKRLFMIYTPIK